MPPCKDPIPIHLPHPLGAPPPHLEAQDALLAEEFSPCATPHQRNAFWLNDAFACDDFRMYDYKVRRCMRGKSHDWTNCPFAHRGEKARRRDPRKIPYSGEPCPDFRKGSCRRGDACVYAHGVFECWLHPARYRTQPCKDGKDCRRKVCFFAHSMQQLRHAEAPVEESLVGGATMMDLHMHEPNSHVQELGFPVGMGSMEEFFREKASRVDSYEEDEVGMALPTNTSALSSGDMYNAHVGSVAGTLSRLTWSSPTQNLSSSPYEPMPSIGFSLNHPTGVPLEVIPPPNLFTVTPGAPSSEMAAISKNNHSLFEQSIVPAIFSSGSPSQQAAARQAFLMHERYGKGGKRILNLSTYEVSDKVHYRGYGGTAHGCMNASRRGGLDEDEVANELSEKPKLICSTNQPALLGKDLSSYNSCGSYGLSSPTSTLAGPFYISSFLSPPLSPLNTPNSDTSNSFSSRGDGNALVDNRIPKADAHILSRHCGRELELKHISTDQEFLHANHRNQLMGYGALSQCLEPPSPSFSQHTFGQNKWSPVCIEGAYKPDVMPDSMRQKVCDRFGEEGLAENTMPDLGWVCELVM